MKILYVDDEPDIREVAFLSLELQPGFEVQTCASGREALEEARRWQPDLIMLDVMMPGMDGPTTLAELRAAAETATIPVIFITARTQSHEIDRFRALGAIGVIAKPFDPMSLGATVQRLVAG